MKKLCHSNVIWLHLIWAFKEEISDLSAIREFAGHVDESTLLKEYVFSTKKDERRTLVEQALSPKPWTQSFLEMKNGKP